MLKNFSKTFLIGSLLVLNTGCNDLRFYIVYPTIETAKDDGAFNRGWLPKWLPSDAQNIHEHHNLDTNSRAFSFSIARSSKFEWPKQCKFIETIPAPILKTHLFPKNVHKLPDIKKCDDLFIVRDINGIIHAWT